MHLPRIAVVGRPNVGKSSIFNVLARRRIAIVDEQAGITRDRVSAEIRIGARRAEIIDTGGMGIEDADDLTADVERQIEIAMREADVLLFVVDIRDGVTPLDEFAADRVRRLEKPVILVANKADNPNLANLAGEFPALGVGEALVTSTKHNRGIGDLRESLEEALADFPVEGQAPQETGPVKIAIVGKRNAGKSTLVNYLAGESRVIVSDVPGTTRDSVDVGFEIEGRRFVAIDTAGLRRAKSVKEAVDYYGMTRTHRSISRADVVIFLMDCSTSISAVDKKLGASIVEAHKPVVIALNKYDLASDVDPEKFRKYIDARLKGLSFAPVVFISAATGFNVGAALEIAEDLWSQANSRVTTGELNRAVAAIVERRRPRAAGGRLPKVYYATQAAVAPVTIVLFVSNPKAFRRNYIRYVENALRRTFFFEEVPLRIILRESGGGAGPRPAAGESPRK
ncbi:MAG: ribosome biogenesis GTPase Der [Planctomycetes bacterium]|nr:ribosome biogenesis GTPase Der [Planctomycetota bacterium]